MNTKTKTERSSARRRAFTIIELMIVIAIMGVLAGVVTIGAMSQLKKAKIKRVEMDADTIRSALKLYYVDYNTYPTTEDGLQALVATGNLEQLPRDPWNNMYLYYSPMPNHPYQIHCAGPDGNIETTNDNLIYYPPEEG